MTPEHWLWEYRHVLRKLRHTKVKGVPVPRVGRGNRPGHYSAFFPKHWHCRTGCDICYSTRSARERQAVKIEDTAY